MITRKSYCLFFLLIVFYSENVFSQNLDLNRVGDSDVEWSEGSVTLNNGTVLTGLLKLYHNTGLLGFESGATSKSFTARTVLGFSYFDVREQKQRNFLSLTYDDSKPKDDDALAVVKKDRQTIKSEKGVPTFFEILVECKKFALINKVGRLSIKQNTGEYINDPANPNAGKPGFQNNNGFATRSTTYMSNETLLILAEDGTMEIVLDITNTEVERAGIDSKKTKGKAEETVIGKYTAPHYGAIVKFARERELKFKNREDLIQIFEYYKSLTTD